jgi:hypothetical protein
MTNTPHGQWGLGQQELFRFPPKKAHREAVSGEAECGIGGRFGLAGSTSSLTPFGERTSTVSSSVLGSTGRCGSSGRLGRRMGPPRTIGSPQSLGPQYMLTRQNSQRIVQLRSKIGGPECYVGSWLATIDGTMAQTAGDCRQGMDVSYADLWRQPKSSRNQLDSNYLRHLCGQFPESGKMGP